MVVLAQEEVVGGDAEVLDGLPPVGRDSGWGQHIAEVAEHGEGDRPLAVRWRIFSGKSTKHVLDLVVPDGAPARDGVGEKGVRTHQLGERRADGAKPTS